MTLSMPAGEVPSPERLRATFAKMLHKHWFAFFLEGIVLIVLGVLAVAVPPLASLAVAFFLGWLFLVGGAVGLVMTFLGHHLPGFWWSLLSALLAIVVGGMLIGWPVGGLLSLTLLLTAFFIVDGVSSIMFAVEHRRHGSNTWGWLLLSGAIDLLLAAFIFWGFPGTAAWAIGLIVGIDFIFGGSSLMMVALKARATSA